MTTNGSNGNDDFQAAGSHTLGYITTKAGREIPRGASQVGVFDLVPRVGYREYWYPAIHDKLVGRKPVGVKMLGDDLVFFRSADGTVQSLTDYCPHRGAMFSGGKRRQPGAGPQPGKQNDAIKGHVTCPYHGFVFDAEGICVAALTEGPESGLVGKLKAQKYPTTTHFGIVWVWMGETEPVPPEEDIPYLFDPDIMGETHVRMWDINWSLTIENSQDSHAGWVHRGSRRKVFTRVNFRPTGSFTTGMKIVDEGPNYFQMSSAGRGAQAYFPTIDQKWPKRTWFRFLKPGGGRAGPSGNNKQKLDPTRKGGEYMLPCIASPGIPGSQMHLRYAVPVTGDTCRMWNFTLTRKSFYKNFFSRWMWRADYHMRWTYFGTLQAMNELEDLPVQSVGCLDPDKPQKLGASDGATIYWRRRLPLRSRDHERLWSKQAQEHAAEVQTGLERQEIAEEPLAAG